MPYRTAPEKPVKIEVSLTPKEVEVAVRKYVEDEKKIAIPEGFRPVSVKGDNGRYHKPETDEGAVVTVAWKDETK